MLTQEFTGRVWENGEFGVAVVKTFELEPMAVDIRSPAERENAEWMLNALKVHGWEAVADCYGLEPLGSSILPKNHRELRRGAKGISGHGRRLVRNACRRLELERRLSELTFATFTLPDVDRSESLSVGRHWGEVCRKFFQALTRKLKARGLPGEVVHVTEIQESRSYRDKVLGLHLHCVFVGRVRGRTWAMTPSEYREIWKRILSGYLERRSEEYNWDAVENIQRVKKSIEGYLGKYMSKGLKALQTAASYFGEENLPRAWYGCTNSLRSRVLRSVRTVTGEAATRLVEDCNSFNAAIFAYVCPICIAGPSGRLVVVGWYGRINPDWVQRYVRDKAIVGISGSQGVDR